MTAPVILPTFCARAGATPDTRRAATMKANFKTECGTRDMPSIVAAAATPNTEDCLNCSSGRRTTGWRNEGRDAGGHDSAGDPVPPGRRVPEQGYRGNRANKGRDGKKGRLTGGTDVAQRI